MRPQTPHQAHLVFYFILIFLLTDFLNLAKWTAEHEDKFSQPITNILTKTMDDHLHEGWFFFHVTLVCGHIFLVNCTWSKFLSLWFIYFLLFYFIKMENNSDWLEMSKPLFSAITKFMKVGKAASSIMRHTVNICHIFGQTMWSCWQLRCHFALKSDQQTLLTA